jgi:demethoxyubiquinone hydroxylase (CLK1/Coq7/Cat5 family)
MPSSGMLRRVALVRSDVAEERSFSIIRVTRIGELGLTLVVTGSRSTLQRNTIKVHIGPTQRNDSNIFVGLSPLDLLCFSV